MTIFTYVMRRKQYLRTRKTINSVVQPVKNLVVKRWSKRWQQRRPLSRGLIRLRARFRYQPNPPQPSNLVIKRWPKRWQARRPLSRGLIRLRARFRYPFAKSIFLFKPFKRLVLKRKKFFAARKRYVAAPAPSNLVVKRWPKRWLPRRSLRRGLIRTPWRVRSPNPALPVSVLYRAVRLKLRPRRLLARFFRPRLPRLVLGVILTLFKPRRLVLFKRRKVFAVRKRYVTPPLPAGFVPIGARRRLKIRRMHAQFRRKVAVTGFLQLLFKSKLLRWQKRRPLIRGLIPKAWRVRSPNPLLPVTALYAGSRRIIVTRTVALRRRLPGLILGLPQLLFKPQRRPRIKRTKLRIRSRTYSFSTAVAGLVIKKWPRRWQPRRPMRRGLIRAWWRWRSPSPPPPARVVYRNVQRRPPWKRKLMRRSFFKARLLYVIPAVVIKNVTEWLIRARRRGQR